ncbi:transposable element Tc3 transposase [Trichonephila clavipes]|nr:transposable element Tc3 transposase [Trichonephila clavipes]
MHDQEKRTTLEPAPPILASTLTEGLFEYRTNSTFTALNYMAGLQRYQARTHDTPATSPLQRPPMSNWPPRSCDLTPLDYFLWGHVKSLVYVDKPQTLDHLKDNIRRVIADIRPQMLEKVIENWTSRLDYIRGSHIPEIIFKNVMPQDYLSNKKFM